MLDNQYRETHRLSAKSLQQKWGICFAHALYHHRGEWYHHLKRFPGALFDPDGYVRFATQEEYLKCLGLQHGEDLHVPGGIKKLPGYVRVNPP